VFTPSISSPPYQMLPHSLLEWMRPASAFNKVDLPWPDGASSSVVVPGLSVPDTLFKMGTSWLYPEPRPPVSIPLSMDPTVEMSLACSVHQDTRTPHTATTQPRGKSTRERMHSNVSTAE